MKTQEVLERGHGYCFISLSEGFKSQPFLHKHCIASCVEMVRRPRTGSYLRLLQAPASSEVLSMV